MTSFLIFLCYLLFVHILMVPVAWLNNNDHSINTVQTSHSNWFSLLLKAQEGLQDWQLKSLYTNSRRYFLSSSRVESSRVKWRRVEGRLAQDSIQVQVQVVCYSVFRQPITPQVSAASDQWEGHLRLYPECVQIFTQSLSKWRIFVSLKGQ